MIWCYRRRQGRIYVYICFELMRRQRHHHNSFVMIVVLYMSHHCRRQRVPFMTWYNVQRNKILLQGAKPRLSKKTSLTARPVCPSLPL